MKKNLQTKETAKNLIARAGKDVEQGMEYLHGLEFYEGDCAMYDIEDINRFINRD